MRNMFLYYRIKEEVVDKNVGLLRGILVILATSITILELHAKIFKKDICKNRKDNGRRI